MQNLIYNENVIKKKFTSKVRGLLKQIRSPNQNRVAFIKWSVAIKAIKFARIFAIILTESVAPSDNA